MRAKRRVNPGQPPLHHAALPCETAAAAILVLWAAKHLWGKDRALAVPARDLAVFLVA